MASSNLLVNALRGSLVPLVQRQQEEQQLAAELAAQQQKAQAAQLLEVLRQSGRSNLQGQRDTAAADRLVFTEGEKGIRQEDRQKERRREGRQKRRGKRQEARRDSLDKLLLNPENITDALIQSARPRDREVLKGSKTRDEELRRQKQVDALAREDRRSANIAARQRPKSTKAGTVVIPDSSQFADDINRLAVEILDKGQVRLDPNSPDTPIQDIAFTEAMDRTLRANFGFTLAELQALGADISNPLSVFEEAVAEFQSRRGGGVPAGLRPLE